RSAVDVASKISELRCAEVGGRVTIAGSGIHERRGDEVHGVEVAIIHARMNICARKTGGDRATGREAGPGSAGCQPATDECSSRGRIDDRKWRARLEDGNSADGPVPEENAFGTCSLLEEGQVITVADCETMLAIEVREATRVFQIRFIVERRIESGVAAGRGVGGFRPGVGRLEVTGGPAARLCRL